MGPPIIFQHGAHKTASSYCAQLLRQIAAHRGWDQEEGHAKLGDPELNGWIEDMKSASFDGIPGGTVIKTHDVPGAARELLESGRAVAFVTIRDPWDSVRSLMDHAEAKEGEQAPEFKWLKTPVEAAELHLLHRAFTLLWLRLPNVYAISYDKLRTEPEECVRLMCAVLEVDADPAALVADAAAPRRLNVGVPGRGDSFRDSEFYPDLQRMFGFLENEDLSFDAAEEQKSRRKLSARKAAQEAAEAARKAEAEAQAAKEAAAAAVARAKAAAAEAGEDDEEADPDSSNAANRAEGAPHPDGEVTAAADNAPEAGEQTNSADASSSDQSGGKDNETESVVAEATKGNSRSA